MQRVLVLIFFLVVGTILSSYDGGYFKANQMKYDRVRQAYKEKLPELRQLYHLHALSFATQQIYLRAFKEEQELELWARSGSQDTFRLVKTYPFCRTSGCIGPKRICGDKQVPEGFYHINEFNPSSKYYLSLGINYPNASDRILGSKVNTGGDIFIHGSCVSIGCISITDDLIKEIYILAVEAYSGGQTEIPTHIFPCKMTDRNIGLLQEHYGRDSSMIGFWKNLKTGYDLFEISKKVPQVRVDANTGKYQFNTIYLSGSRI
jgi:murein L,D-transpeptidase YafK